MQIRFNPQPATRFMREVIHDTVMAGTMAAGGYLGGAPGIAATTAAAGIYGASSPNETWVERREYGLLAGLFCSTLGCFGPAGIAAAAGIAFGRKLIQLLDGGP